MKIRVSVKAQSKQESIQKIREREYLVRVKAPAQEGKANEAVGALLAKHFKLPKSGVMLLHGAKSKEKVFQIEKDL